MISLVRFVLGLLLVLSSLFLILLVLVQRGRGGGLAGALGGMGGQSAFGTKAGDVFTKITVGVAAFWICLCVLAINVLGRQQSLLSGSLGSGAPTAVTAGAGTETPAATGAAVPASPVETAVPAATTGVAADAATSAPAAPVPPAEQSK